MMKPTDDFLFILNCLQLPEDAVRKAQLQRWLEADVRNNELYEKVKLLWEQAAETRYFEGADAAAATRRFLEKLDGPLPVIYMPTRSPWWKRAAAAAAILISTAMGWYWYKTSVAIAWLSKTTGNTIDSLLLSDGSRIVLNKHATVRYPATFKGHNRTVTLQSGEAFFDIATDPGHPFILTSGPAQIKVLGTSFNVKNSPHAVQVFVLTGSISLQQTGGTTALRLAAGKGGVFYSDNGDLNEDAGTGYNQLSWRTHELRFENAPIGEVCSALSDYYGVTIIPDYKISHKRKLNANFSNRSLEEVKATLSALYDYSFEQQADTLYVK
ncbi:FecR family protein [Chitinophaga nivalis]|uniref:FecR domain-containing protein n=1 Tax=Chitinophaga nivalis TaxID=2991709 RepID=A0ABT3ITR2_9BACT|nr:FecR family protein [Chitinophaga nivalis]MCW3462947.1 FecR domain-containing protein [Chitinophaga nivalis]MCW3487363.1 FecR domain-containing protein [Chitinophaga nivalis]